MNNCPTCRITYLPPRSDEPALHRAARIGEHPTIRRLAAEGADLNATANICRDDAEAERLATPLMVAAGSAEGASQETVELLIQLGADATFEHQGWNAVDYACMGLGWEYEPGGDAGRLRALIRAGCELPTNAKYVNMLLCSVAEAGDPERLRMLLDHGASPHGYWNREEALEEHDECEAELAEKFGTKYNLYQPSDPEYWSWMEEERKRKAEDRERSCSAPSGWRIPLFQAASSGNVECVRMLLAAGAEACQRDNQSQTAMYEATSAEMVRELIAAGVPIEDKDFLDWSPLEHAVACGLHCRVRALIAGGVDVHVTDDSGWTMLMRATLSTRCVEVMRPLVEAGVDPHAVSRSGWTALHAAISDTVAHRESVVRDTLGYLLSLGLDINARTDDGSTPLARACETGSSVHVRALCDLGADVGRTSPLFTCGNGGCRRDEFLPPLFHAISGVASHLKMEALLEAGADPRVRDAQGRRPVDRVIERVCQDAGDKVDAVMAFRHALCKLRFPAHGLRDAFIVEAKGAINAAIRPLASAIPVGTTYEYEGEWREQRLQCITLLVAHEVWTTSCERVRGPASLEIDEPIP